MHLIKLDATSSTNSSLKEIWQNEDAEDWTVIWAKDQFGGRGQKGTIWHSEPGKNLTFSVLKIFDSLNAEHQFLFNMAVSLAVSDALKELKVPQVHVKWPNDILSGPYKICGILIENMVKAREVRAAIIGIGLNVNQDDFSEIHKAASLKTIMGTPFELESILHCVVKQLKRHLQDFGPEIFETVKDRYQEAMYRHNVTSTFSFPDGTKTNGIIRGISDTGKLIVDLADSTRTFDMKEIELLN